MVQLGPYQNTGRSLRHTIGKLGPSRKRSTSLAALVGFGFKADVTPVLSMERLKSAVPAELRQAVGEGTAADLPATTSRLLAFFEELPLFHQVRAIICPSPPPPFGTLVLLFPTRRGELANLDPMSMVCRLSACFLCVSRMQGYAGAHRPGARSVPEGQGESDRVERPGQRVLLQEGV